MDEVVDQEWVSAAATRNYMARNPLVDWLHLYGHGNGFKQDDELPGYDPRAEFTNFIPNTDSTRMCQANVLCEHAVKEARFPPHRQPIAACRYQSNRRPPKPPALYLHKHGTCPHGRL